MQMVLPVDTVMYQSQEVAAVIATSRYAAADGVAAVLVDYEPLPVIVDPHKALEADAFVLRPDRGPDKQNNHIWHWESGDAAKPPMPRSPAAEVTGSARTSTSRASTSPRSRLRLRRRLGIPSASSSRCT
jgi:CO/xanthine dehydrogenase Mo-binding subunit